MYQKIYDFCKVKNSGSIYKNGLEQTNRVKWIINLLKSNNIDYIIDEFNLSKDTKCWNIILPGDSKMSVCAHHDIVNPNSDNANDNSASVINAIMTHVLNPSITPPPTLCVGDVASKNSGFSSSNLTSSCNSLSNSKSEIMEVSKT